MYLVLQDIRFKTQESGNVLLSSNSTSETIKHTQLTEIEALIADLRFYVNPFAQTGTLYIRIPKTNDTAMVIKA